MTSSGPHKTQHEEAPHPEGLPHTEAGVHPDEHSAPPHGDPFAEQALGAETVEPSEVLDGEPEPDQAADADAEELAEDVDSLQDRAAEYLALAQRTQADFENYRKRMAREAAVAADRGVAKVAKELLPALDHLELALQAAEADGDTAHAEWAKGIRLIQAEFVGALNRVGIQPFSPVGEPFDPAEHEALSQRPAGDADVQPGTVIEVYQQGYRLNGGVLRPARVVVAE